MRQTKMHANIYITVSLKQTRRKGLDFSQAQTSNFTRPQCNERCNVLYLIARWIWIKQLSKQDPSFFYSNMADPSGHAHANTHTKYRWSLQTRLINNIIERGWGKYRDLSVVSRETDKLKYFAIAEFNNCFIIRSPSLFLMNIFFKWSDLPFSRKSDRKKKKSVASCTHKQNIICSQTQLVDERAWTDHHL